MIVEAWFPTADEAGVPEPWLLRQLQHYAAMGGAVTDEQGRVLATLRDVEADEDRGIHVNMEILDGDLAKALVEKTCVGLSFGVGYDRDSEATITEVFPVRAAHPAAR